MEKKQFILILGRYLKQQATPDEEKLLHTYYHLFMADSDVLLLLSDDEKEKLKLQIKTGIEAAIENADEKPVRPAYKPWPRIAVAAAVIAIVFIGVKFIIYWNNPARDVIFASPRPPQDIAPGKNTATLTLANGKTITLSDAKTGVMVSTNSLKYNDGSPVEASSLGAHELLTASTPRGGMYQITLPDGTRVWLNADTKISFPAQFMGKERKISLINGEVYFEVTKNKEKPFVVVTDKQEVTVLGTHFNISAYKDENSVRTTLLEGSVRVNLLPTPTLSYRRAGVVLKPNQQAVATFNNQIDVKAVDVNDVIDWKNGDFVFKGETLESIMRKVARWYNVQVVYTADAPKSITLGGYVSRSRNISAVLELIERTGKVKFKLEGTTVTVTK